MKCPVDQTTLKVKEREGIEISYCPSCHGVWLGKTELDQVIKHGETDINKDKVKKEEKPDYPDMKEPKEVRDQKPDQEWVQSSLRRLFDF